MDQNGPAQSAFALPGLVPADAPHATPSGDLSRIAAILTMLLIFATIGTLASGANWPMDSEQRTILLAAAVLGLLGAICGLATALLRRPPPEQNGEAVPLLERLEGLANALASQVTASQTTLLRSQDHGNSLLSALVQADQRLQRAATQAEQRAGRPAEPVEAAVPPAMTEALLQIADITGRTARQVERLERAMPELLQALTVMHGESAPSDVFDRLGEALTHAETIATASERVGAQMATLPEIAARFEDLQTTLQAVGEQLQSTLRATLAAPQVPVSKLADAVLAISGRIETLNTRVETASGAISEAGDGIAATTATLTALTQDTLPQVLFETTEATQLMQAASFELARQLGTVDIPGELGPVLSRVRAAPQPVPVQAMGAGSDATRLQQIEEWRERHARKTKERMDMLRRQATGEREPEPESEIPQTTAPILLKNLQMTIGQMQNMAAALVADCEVPQLRPEIGVQMVK